MEDSITVGAMRKRAFIYLNNFFCRNVSQELAEAIHSISACGVVVNKARQAPPGVLRTHRTLDTFAPSFSTQVDSLNSGIAGISLATTSSAFSIPAGKLKLKKLQINLFYFS